MKAILATLTVLSISVSAVASQALRCKSKDAQMKADMLVWTPSNGGYISLNLVDPKTGEKQQFSESDLGYMDCASDLAGGSGGFPTAMIFCHTREDQPASQPGSAVVNLAYNVKIGSSGNPENVTASFGGIKFVSTLPTRTIINFSCQLVDFDKANKEFKR